VKALAKKMKRIEYRRHDMHFIVKKYFNDLYNVMKNVYDGLKINGRFVMVVGDSVIAGVYIPTDLLLAQVGKDIGFKVESVVVARKRRSNSDIKLRESRITLAKLN